MAFHSILRRGSASFMPLAIRSVAARRAFHATISAVLDVETRSQVAPQFLPFFLFSTAVSAKPTANVNLVHVLESEIECAEQPAQVKDMPKFPFEIQDNPGERTIILKWKYQDETIKVEVDASSVPGRDDEDDDDADESNVKVFHWLSVFLKGMVSVWISGSLLSLMKFPLIPCQSGIQNSLRINGLMRGRISMT